MVWTEASHFLSHSGSLHSFHTPCVSWLCITGAPALPSATPGTAGAPNWDELHKLRMKAQHSQGNSDPSLGKQSRLQRANLGRDPARNREKSNNSLVIHLMETYPTNRTFRNENSLYLFLSRAMSAANSTRLQGDKSSQSLPLHRTWPQQVTQLQDGTGTLLIPSSSHRPWGCSLRDTPHSSRGEFITKDHTRGKQLVRSVLTMILPSSFWLKKKQCPCLKWKMNTLFYLNHTHISRLERRDTLKMHFWDTSMHPQTAPSSVAGRL